MKIYIGPDHESLIVNTELFLFFDYSKYLQLIVWRFPFFNYPIIPLKDKVVLIENIILDC